jgi:NADPH:quinone reductase-like Zn-dependent oxidoreductase
MKAAFINEHGGPEVLRYSEDLPIPEIKPGEVLVRNHFTSLNRVDTVIRKGYPGTSFNMPHIPGGDIAGVIEMVGEGVIGFNPGDRVTAYPVVLPQKLDPRYEFEHLNDGWKYFGMHLPGSYAEYVAVPAASLFRVPGNLSLETAAVMPIAGLTAYHALYSVAGLKKGDIFMIWGGSGGFGTIAVQLAKLAGATVITTVGKDWKKEKLLAIGADHVFNHFSDDVKEEVKKIFPAGIDVVLDYVGPDTFGKSFELVRKGGKIILCGMLTGMNVQLNIQQTYFRHINIHGINLGSREEFRKLLDLVANSKLMPLIHSKFKLTEAAEAHRLLESGEYLGKILLEI